MLLGNPLQGDKFYRNVKRKEEKGEEVYATGILLGEKWSLSIFKGFIVQILYLLY